MTTTAHITMTAKKINFHGMACFRGQVISRDAGGKITWFTGINRTCRADAVNDAHQFFKSEFLNLAPAQA